MSTQTQQQDSFSTRKKLSVGSQEMTYYSLPEFEAKVPEAKTLPFAHKVLLENLLRCEDGVTVTREDIEALAAWDPKAEPDREIQFRPARTLLQDFTGVPVVADLAAMRGAIQKLGGDPRKINPLQPADLVIDHSVQVDYFGTPDAFSKNTEIEFERNQERYEFLKWGQTSLQNFRVVPPGTGIVHQVNLEYLASVAMLREQNGELAVYPDSLVGTDSHTTMVNGLGVLGWGVGGIEAEAAMLGQPISMLIPHVVGVRLKGTLAAGATATDLVLTVTEMLRKHGVVGKFVEYFGEGLKSLPLADRATISNMAPEYGATCGIFPVDEKTIEYLRLSGRDDETCARVEAYFKAQGMWGSDTEARYSSVLELDLGTVEPSLAGPSRPQDRVRLSNVAQNFETALPAISSKKVELDRNASAHVSYEGNEFDLKHGDVVITAITSCTNTSNPSVLVAAGLLAQKAVARGLKVKPWVKPSLAPGSQVVTDYLKAAGLMPALEALKFNLVGYGCTTCIGNSGPLPDPIAAAVTDKQLSVASVLSGNRNFEGRVNPHVRANYLASPPLVVAYALAGSVTKDLTQEPLGEGSDGKPVFLKDIWPSQEEVQAVVRKFITSELFKKSYANVFEGDPNWRNLKYPTGELYKWDAKSTYIKEPPYFEDMPREPVAPKDVQGARVLALLQDSVTTDHISPAGAIAKDGPAGRYLEAHDIAPKDFNSYGARRGNHEVMIRGTFANIRLKNQMLQGVEGGYTKRIPSGEQTTIFEASEDYIAQDTPLVIFAGKEYGTGSSRDWAAKGTLLLGVKAVVAESFERIHRSNLIGMGVLPLQFTEGASWSSLGLNGSEQVNITGISSVKAGGTLDVKATREDGFEASFKVRVRIDTPNELEYFRHGGILQYVLRQILNS